MNILKKTISFTMLLMGIMLSYSCSDTETIANRETVVPSGLTISSTYVNSGVTVSNTGGTFTIGAQAAGGVTVTSSETWCTATAGTTTSTLSVTPVTITVTANTSTEDRSAAITFTGGGETKTVNLTQLSTAGLIIATTSYSVEASGGTVNVLVSANGEYDYVINNTWISAVETRAGMSNFTEQFTVEANPSSSSREGTITFTRDSLVETVTIIQEAGDASDMALTAKEVASLITAGINIGNTMECPSGEGAWSGAKVNADYIKGLKAAGFNAVRIPCAWHSYITDDSYTIDATWLDRVYEVVGMCVSNDMYVVLNAHWDGGWLEDNIFDASKEDAIKAEQTAIWTQVANKMQGYDQHLIFAACNEPGMNETSGNSARWNSEPDAVSRVVAYEQAMIDAVRATGGNNSKRCIVVQGLGTDITNTYDYMTTLPTDEATDRLLVEVHFYEPYQFCLMEEDASWGNVFWYWGEGNHVDGSEHNADWGEEDHVKTQFAKMKEKYVDNGYPVIIGEYSAMFRTVEENQEMHDKSVVYYGEVVTREAKNAGCVPFYWETGSVINRTTGAVKMQDVIDGIMEGAAAGTYPW